MSKYEIRNKNDQTDKQLDVKFSFVKFTVNQKVKVQTLRQIDAPSRTPTTTGATSKMSNLVVEYINAQNRPFNAQNIADALGRHGIKKGMAQKHLDSLTDKGEIAVEQGGKSFVWYKVQDPEGVLPDDVLKEMEADKKVKATRLAELNGEVAKRKARMMQMAKQLTTKQMKVKVEQLTAENASMETRLVPMRAAKGTSVSASEMKKMEDEFVKHVELWGKRRRDFNDALATILDNLGHSKKKMADELGLEWDTDAATGKLDTFRKTVDTIKRKRAIEARQKKFKRLVA